MSGSLDVVAVPDFLGEQARVFEARTLLFLASWIENAGGASDLSLHLACIGEPPASVRWLARRCDADVSVHEPLDADRGRYSNKLRGLEVRGRGDRVLLVDTDVVVVSDPGGLAEMGQCIAASPVYKPWLPKRYWRTIYPLLDMEPPKERIASALGELLREGADEGLSPGQSARLLSMFPYYNGGVLLLPWDCGLRPLWEDHIRKIAAGFHERDKHWRFLGAGDEVGLATAIELLKRHGVAFKRLPDDHHACWHHVWAGVLRWSDVKLFHAQSTFRALGRSALDADSVWRDMEYYCSHTAAGRLKSKGRFQRVVNPDPQLSQEFVTELRARLRRLFELHIEEALQQVV